MNFSIRPFATQDMDEIVALSILAWEPVFHSFQQILGPTIYGHIYPDWQTSQKEAVTAVCQDGVKYTTLVAETAGRVVGFLAYELNHAEQTGEVYMLAVHPGYQKRGIGTALNTLALAEMKERGMKLAVVGTGGDPGHAPARKAYEKVGYSALPIVRYYKEL